MRYNKMDVSVDVNISFYPVHLTLEHEVLSRTLNETAMYLKLFEIFVTTDF